MLVDTFISLLGLFLIFLVMRDFVHTTLRLQGSGSLSGAIMSSLWKLAKFLRRIFPDRQVFTQMGVPILLADLFAWAFLLWLGWLLVFLPHGGSIVASSSGAPADFWSSAYFVGYSLITLGVGDFAPGSPFFQIATILAAVSGFFLFTLYVTYLVPVVAAVVQARQLAVQVLLLGDTPVGLAEWILRTGPSGTDQLNRLTAPIVLLSQHHFAYPVLTYFPSNSRTTSSGVALAVLDEALSLLEYGLGGKAAVEGYKLSPLRGAIGAYLELHARSRGEELPAAPPPPSLTDLTSEDAKSPAEFTRDLKRLDHRRSLLRQLVEGEGRQWSDVTG